jgi:hypothetical protein
MTTTANPYPLIECRAHAALRVELLSPRPATNSPGWRADSTPCARLPPGHGPGAANCGVGLLEAHAHAQPAVTAGRRIARGDSPTYIHEQQRPTVRLQQ